MLEGARFKNLNSIFLCLYVFVYCVFQPHWLNWCFHHMNQVSVLLKGLAMDVCESSVHIWWNRPQGWKENHVLVLLVEKPFHVATFLLFCYNASASIINKSSATALTIFLQHVFAPIDSSFICSQIWCVLQQGPPWLRVPAGGLGCPYHTWVCSESPMAAAVSVVRSHIGNFFCNGCSSD